MDCACASKSAVRFWTCAKVSWRLWLRPTSEDASCCWNISALQCLPNMGPPQYSQQHHVQPNETQNFTSTADNDSLRANSRWRNVRYKEQPQRQLTPAGPLLVCLANSANSNVIQPWLLQFGLINFPKIICPVDLYMQGFDVTSGLSSCKTSNSLPLDAA